MLAVVVDHGRVYHAVRVDVGKEIGVVVGRVLIRQLYRRRPVAVGGVLERLRRLDVGFAAGTIEVDVHHVDAVVVSRSVEADRAVNRDPFLVRFLAKAGVGREDVVGTPVMGRDPVSRQGCSMPTDGDRDRFIWNSGIRFVADLELMETRFVVEELVGKERLVVVAERVEGADGIGVVGEALVAGDVAHRWPGLAAVEGLVKAEQVVVAFGGREPFGRANQMIWIRGIHADIRLRVVCHELRFSGGIWKLAGALWEIGGRTDVLAGCRTGAGQFAGVTVVGSVADQKRHLRSITTDLLAGHEDVGNVVGPEAVTVGLIGLGALGHIADAEIDGGRGRADQPGGESDAHGEHEPDQQSERMSPPCAHLPPPAGSPMARARSISERLDADQPSVISTEPIERIGEMNWTNTTSLDSLAVKLWK